MNMKHSVRFAFRLGLSLAVFELVLSIFLDGFARLNGLGVSLAFIAPFGIYCGLFRAFHFVFQYRMARFASLLLLASYFVAYISLHLIVASDSATFFFLSWGIGVLLAFWIFFKVPFQLLWANTFVLGAFCTTAVLFPIWFAEDGIVQQEPASTVPAQGPNVVLVSFDTIRADVLEGWGGVGLKTPNLARLAEEGVLFENAVASTPITGPSHATMMTGMYAPSHGLRSNIDTTIAPGTPLLAQAFAQAGWATGGFVSAYPVLGKYGFSKGFHHYDDRLPVPWATTIVRKKYLWSMLLGLVIPHGAESSVFALHVNERAFAWLDSVREKPFFLFLHYYDAHGPYEPSEPWRQQAIDAEATAMPRAVLEKGQESMTLYRAEIAQLDHDFGDMLHKLNELDPGLQNTVILLTSDHGECFGEGGVVNNHVESLYEATQSVPMVLRLPGETYRGTRFSPTVTHLDIAPTLLAAAGIDIPESMTEAPLQLALSGARTLVNRPVYLEAWQKKMREGRKIGWRFDSWKFLRDLRGERLLWNYATLAEGENLLHQETLCAQRMERELDAFLLALPKAVDTGVEVSERDASAMDSLGYAGDDQSEEGVQ